METKSNLLSNLTKPARGLDDRNLEILLKTRMSLPKAQEIVLLK